MKKKLIGALTLALAGTLTLGLAACGGDGETPEVHDDILNGGFEQGFTGWTKSGTAFSQSGVVETDVVGPDGAKITAGKKDKYFFSGFDAGNAQFTGTLTSDPFVLGGTGKIGFLMGGGMNKEKCYVEFFEQGNDTALLKVANEAFDIDYVTGEMVRVVADLSAHVGKTIYIKITDDDKGDADEYAYLNLDDFVVYKTDPEVAAAEKERADKLYEIGKPTFSEDPTSTTIKNGGFEERLHNWLVLEGDAFLGKSLYNSADKFWDVRSYNAEGEHFLCTYYDEGRVGAIRSTKFTLAGDGVISFLMAGAKNDGSYVAVCDGETDEEIATVAFENFFNDPNLSENMVRFYVKLADNIGDVLYIKVVDGERSDFAGICVDEFKVSMTEEETKAQMKADYEWAMTLGDDAVAKKTQEYYSTKCNYPYELAVLRFETKVTGKAIRPSDSVDLTAYLSEAKAIFDGNAQESDFSYAITSVTKNGTSVATEGFNAVDMSTAGLYAVAYTATYDGKTIEETFFVDVAEEHSILNGGFEAGSLAGWEVVEGADKVNTAAAASNAYYGFTNAPYNQAGSYHFDGAAAAEETATYTLRSSDFVLGGAGIISFKLGGNAARLRVIDKTSGVILAEFTNTAFSDTENPHVEKGCRNLTMTTYYYTVPAEFLGLTMYIEVSDTASVNWGVLHFDDIVTYYEAGTTAETLAAKKDTVIYTCEGGEDTFEIEWLPASNAITPNLLVVKEVPEYVEVLADAIGSTAPNSYLDEIEGGVVGQEEPAITKSIVKITCDGEDDVTSGFDTFRFAAGKTYTVFYRLSYTPDGGDEMTADGSFVVKALNEYQIQNGGFETGDLTGWTASMDLAAAVNKRYTYWGEKMPLNQTGNYLLNAEGEVITEGLKWTLKSSVFTLGGSGVISFKMGGNGGEFRVYSENGILLATYKNTMFANPDGAFPYVAKGCRLATMTTYVADLSQFIGVKMYIELADTADSNFGFACFDEIVTYYEGNASEVKTALLAKKDTVAYAVEGAAVDIDWEEAANTIMPNLLAVTEQPEYVEIASDKVATTTLDSFKEDIHGAVVGVTNATVTVTFTKVNDGSNDITSLEGFTFTAGKTYTVYFKLTYTPDGGAEMTAEGSFTVKALHEGQIRNGGFETGDLEGWTTDTENFNTDTAVLGADKYWGEELPYNQSGNYHLDGWNTGIAEEGTWSVKSETFVLGGAGIITVKMGGRAAAVKVYQVNGDTETLIGHYKQSRDIDPQVGDPPASVFPDVSKGAWADMATYVIDLSDHLNQTLRIELCDEEVAGGWAHAFFDEVITYYEAGTQTTTLLQKKDTVKNGHTAGETAEDVDIPWIEATNSNTASADDTTD